MPTRNGRLRLQERKHSLSGRSTRRRNGKCETPSPSASRKSSSNPSRTTCFLSDMTPDPSREETATWQRRLAGQANNRAWRLSESAGRSPKEDEEMLQAAHASMYFWTLAGSAGNRAHAALLVAHVYALLRLPNQATHYLAQSEPFFLGQSCEPWEKACAFAVKAGVFAAAGRSEGHGSSYREAERLIAALPDAEDREILNATLRVVPKPDGA